MVCSYILNYISCSQADKAIISPFLRIRFFTEGLCAIISKLLTPRLREPVLDGEGGGGGGGESLLKKKKKRMVVMHTAKILIKLFRQCP